MKSARKICHEGLTEYAYTWNLPGKSVMNGLTEYAYTWNLPEKSVIKARLNMHTHKFCQKNLSWRLDWICIHKKSARNICHEGLTEYAYTWNLPGKSVVNGLTEYAYTWNLPEKSVIKARLNMHTHKFCQKNLSLRLDWICIHMKSARKICH